MSAPLIKSLIVDDEPIARQVLREELDQIHDVEIVGEAEHGEEALRMIAGLQPDVVFLDLQMPGMSGFEVIRKLEGGKLPIVLIVTAYDQHAIQAFEAGAVDYLLKPVTEVRLRKALDRVRRLYGKRLEIAESLAQMAATPHEPQAAARTRRIVGSKGEEYFLLDLDEVLAFQADGELVWIVTGRQRFLATQPLRALEERLKDQHFRRVHRNAMVNLNHVRKMSSLSSQRWLLTLDNGLELVVSKRQAHAVREMLRW
ncbi:MAG: LytTR family DNA-binding domain-containing protein [Bryobacteraceae bacterium]|jgi:DNA-binding LytR/AlgR family response regulator